MSKRHDSGGENPSSWDSCLANEALRTVFLNLQQLWQRPILILVLLYMAKELPSSPLELPPTLGRAAGRRSVSGTQSGDGTFC